MLGVTCDGILIRGNANTSGFYRLHTTFTMYFSIFGKIIGIISNFEKKIMFDTLEKKRL